MASREELTGISVFFFLFVIVGCFTNLIAIITFIKYRKTMLQQSKDLLLFSIALGDLTQSIFAVPLSLTSVIAGRWLWGDEGCYIYAFVTSWTGLSNIAHFSIVAVERLTTLKSPTVFLISKKRVIKWIVFIWFVTFIVASLPLFGWSSYTYEGYGLHCSIFWESKTTGNLTYCLFLLVVFFVVPVGSIIFSNAKLYVTVNIMYKNANSMWGANAPATKQSYFAQVKVAQQFTAMSLAFLAVWSPYAALSFARVVLNTNLSSKVREYPSMFAKTGVLWNPTIYFYLYRKLRKRAIDTLKCRSVNSVQEVPRDRAIAMEDATIQ